MQSLICLLTSLKSFPGPLLKSGVGPFARHGNYQEIVSGRLEKMYTSSDTRLKWPGEGPLFESDSNKRRGGKMGPLFESPPRPLLKLGLQPMGRYSTHQETTSRRPEQMYTPSDTRLEWLGAGPLFKSVSNKRWKAKVQPLFESFHGPLLKSAVGPLARYGNHQEIIRMRLEQTSSDTKLEWPGEGLLFESDSNKRWGWGQNGSTINQTTFAI